HPVLPRGRRLAAGDGREPALRRRLSAADGRRLALSRARARPRRRREASAATGRIPRGCRHDEVLLAGRPPGDRRDARADRGAGGIRRGLGGTRDADQKSPRGSSAPPLHPASALALLLGVLVIVAGCGRAVEPVPAPKAPAAPLRHVRYVHRVQVTVLDGDTGRRLVGARVTVGARSARTNRRGVALVPVQARTPLATRVVAEGYSAA